jgi:hypothetical protein
MDIESTLEWVLWLSLASAAASGLSLAALMIFARFRR